MLSRPVIDAHHHFWDPAVREYPALAGARAPLRRRFGPDDLRPELELEGMTGTVLMQALPQVEETVDLLATATTVPFVDGVVGWVDLTAPDVSERIAALRSGPGGELLVGVRHPVCDEADPRWLCRDDVRRGLEAVAAAGLAFDLHLRTRELPAAHETCAALPQLRFVLDHLASPPIASGDLSAWGSALLVLAERPNVSAKLSGLVTEADWRTWSIDDLRHPVELAVDAFGPHRLMIGSDWPTCLLAGAYVDAIDPMRYLLADLPEHQQDEVRGGTAVHVYGLGGGAAGT
ncbi:MAG: amidohydrolase family protein [Chloroflexota bacterium]